MATIRRHPVPIESYNPDRPLNDLVREQLAHFVHVAERLPPKLQAKLPVPSAEDAAAANRFIAAVTEELMSIKRSPLKLVKKDTRKSPVSGIAIAAQAEALPSPRSSRKKKTRSKSKPGNPGK